MGTLAAEARLPGERGSFLHRNAALILAVLAAASLAVFPATMCFDCEPDYTYGRSAAINDFGWLALAFWLILVPFLSALLRLRHAWILPLAVVIANIGTQHIGGVPWWNLAYNEGPILLIFGLIAGFASLGLGCLCEFIVASIRSRIPTAH